MSVIETLGVLGALLGVLKLVPQLILTVRTGDVKGLSLLSLVLGYLGSILLVFHILLAVDLSQKLVPLVTAMLTLNVLNVLLASLLLAIVIGMKTRRKGRSRGRSRRR